MINKKAFLIVVAALATALVLNGLAFTQNVKSTASDPAIVLRIPEILGESTAARHVNEIDILSFDWMEAMQSIPTSGAGIPTMPDFNFTMLTNKASPLIFSAVITGTVYHDARLTVMTIPRTGGAQVEFLIWEFRNVRFTSFSQSDTTSNNRPTEKFSIAFSWMRMSYTPISPSGSRGTTIVREWPTPPHPWNLNVVSAHGSPNPSVGVHSYPNGYSVTCSVTTPVIEDDVSYACTGWIATGSLSASGSGTSVTFTITSDSTITWNWQGTPVQYGLLVGVSGSGTTNATGTAMYNAKTVVAVSATPDEGWTFDSWLLNGSNVGSANPYVVTMSQNYNLTAVFTVIPPVQWTLTVSSDHDSPSPSVGSYLYNDGSTVTCSVSSPVIEDGISYTCTGWTGTGSVVEAGTDLSVTFTITMDSSITWTWVETPM